MIDKLERRFGSFAIPHLVTLIVAGQAAAYVLMRFKPQFAGQLMLNGALVKQGQVWRLFTFIFDPPDINIIFLFFALYLLYLYGQALEAYWGSFKLNVFLGIGWVLTIASSFVFPHAIVPKYILVESVFLAFAYLNPNFELLLFFILPVKVRWLAWLVWLQLGYVVVTGLRMGSFAELAFVTAGVLNYFIFFGRDFYHRIRSGNFRRQRRKEQARVEAQPTHKCSVCGITDKEKPDEQFRYCSKCKGRHAYCSEHLKSHVHVMSDAP